MVTAYRNAATDGWSITGEDLGANDRDDDQDEQGHLGFSRRCLRIGGPLDSPCFGKLSRSAKAGWTFTIRCGCVPERRYGKWRSLDVDATSRSEQH